MAAHIPRLFSSTVKRVASGMLPSHMAVRGAAFSIRQRDTTFVMNEVLNATEHYKQLGNPDCNEELIESIISNCSSFAMDKLYPLDVVGDKQGCKLTKDGAVTPKGFKEAYEEYVAGGWQSMSVHPNYGGQGLPLSLGLLKAEIIGTANWSFGMYPGLSIGAMNTLTLHASEEQKQTYLTKLAAGTWSGTMCLTEPQCGTDLSQVATRAERQADGSFKLNGTKIFISAGDHDLTENIIHIVLARIDGAPPGLAGISLFLVPKYLVGKDGSLAKDKNIVCSRLENKMGIHGSTTCEMQFENSTGFLIGAENSGLKQMFTFMNTARIGTALQGVGSAERAFQGALDYAKNRLAMRSLTGAKFPEKIADPILEQPDVRRMVLTAKAFAEGGRCMVYHTAMLADHMIATESAEERRKHDDYLGLFTPILKGFLTEVGLEAAKDGIQVWGGHGYIKENGMEQIDRDARIATLYEGTTGVQALDLLGRKVVLNKGKNLMRFHKEIFSYTKSLLIDNYSTSNHKLAALRITGLTLQWSALTAKLFGMALMNKNAVGSASYDYLLYSGYIVMGYFWLRMMETASAKLKANPTGPDADFYKGKIATGEFYFDRILPRTKTLAKTMGRTPTSLMSITYDQLSAGHH